MPRRFEHGGPSDSFVEKCRARILVGDPLAREAVSTEQGPSMQRGGCMVLFHKSFALLQTEQIAPQVQLASEKWVASRRSDSLWVQRHCNMSGKVSVVRRHLSVLHDNIHDKVPSPQKIRETVAVEMIGAIVCRPPSQRQLFTRDRVQALKCSIARIRGICKVLRSRPYFVSTTGLASFVGHLEDMFDATLWRKEVFDVIHHNLQMLESWSPDQHHSVLKRYVLQESERAFLGSDHPSFPDAAVLHLGPGAPIPCLHRVHEDGKKLTGAHFVQETIGMSIALSDAVAHLRKLSQLSEDIAGCRPDPKLKSLVTMDDGFRDVMLLRPIFRELSHSLQPVLFVPSALLRGSNGSLSRRHLPLTCLYDHCFHQGIDDPDDFEKCGDARRSALKTIPEAEQYKRLELAGIPTDVSTYDLLSVGDLRELSLEGWWICSHGPDHSDLTRARAFRSIEKELIADFMFLRQNGWAPWFAWPEGRWCSRTADALAIQQGGPSAQFGLAGPMKGEVHHKAVVSRVAWLGGEHKLKVLVTGSQGFLGRHLCLVLQGNGYEVHGYDFSDGYDILDREMLTREVCLMPIESRHCTH